MAFLVVAYPEISKTDFEEIQNFRSQHDALYYHLVQPHFTIVFPIDNIPENVFRAEVISKAKTFSKFSFVLRSAVVNKDAFSNQFHIFLVPDEGFSALIKLHDLKCIAIPLKRITDWTLISFHILELEIQPIGKL